MLAELKTRASRWFLKDPSVVPACGGVTHRHLEAALDWLNQHSSPQGLLEHNKSNRVYPEVTGYTIPTLLHIGERSLARFWGKALVDLQLPCGALPAPGSQLPYVFDTGQVVRGWLALHPLLPELSEPIRRACDWLLECQDRSGRLTTPDQSYWSTQDGRGVPEAVHLYCLGPLLEAGALLGVPAYVQAANRATESYLEDMSVTSWHSLSHFLGYIIEALIELDRPELANNLLDQVERQQRHDGAIPAYPGESWTCSTGTAQLALSAYRLGRCSMADRAMANLCDQQTETGGFLGSWGRRATYFVDREIAWAAKYFIDAALAGIGADFESQVHAFPTQIDCADGRLVEVTSFLSSTESLSVLDAGCGRGRFLNALQSALPQHRYCGMDLANNMLSDVVEGIDVCQGGLLKTPFEDATFDRVICVEALEHVVFAANAVRELCRITKPGGRVLIIDKNDVNKGALETKTWERWFGVGEVCGLLSDYCDHVAAKPVAHGGKVHPDNLLVAWSGRVR